MSDATTLEAFQALHRELVAVCEYRNDGLDILNVALEDHAEQFRNLISKKPRKQESRKAVESGKITIKDEDYSINKEFQDYALQLADELDLDEIEAAGLLLDAKDDMVTLGRPLLECGLIQFHQQRKYLLDCMRLCIKLADDPELDPNLQTFFGDYVAENIYVVARPGQPAAPADTQIVPRCMAAMQEIRTWLQKLGDRATAASVLQERLPADVQEMFDFSRMSLLQQHEGVVMIVCGAVGKRHVRRSDFESFLKLLQKWDRYDSLLVHLFPILALHIRIFGSPDGVCDLEEVRKLNDIVVRREDDNAWQLPSLRAAVCAWWVAEYSGWYADDMGIPPGNIDLDKEDGERADLFSDCLEEGALDFILSVSSDVEAKDWQDPTPSGVQLWLQRKCPPLPSDSVPFSDYFRVAVMEQLEGFVDAFISNLPDIIRQLRVEEDEQRQLSQTHEQSLELERFLLIIAHAYEGRPEAAEAFWADPESNLAGFMQWASHRASTPLVSAFCEMLRSVSGNEASANAAHDFLLDEVSTTTSTGRIRKSQSLTWHQIVKELAFFTTRIRSHTGAAPAVTYRGGKPSDEQEEAEPESAIMLGCYLRLIARVSTNSSTARFFLLNDEELMLVATLFGLASLPVPGPLRACVFTALKALLSDKELDMSYNLWECVENFMAGRYIQQPQQQTLANTTTPAHYMDGFFTEIGREFEQPYAFIQLLLVLVTPSSDQSPLNDALPFPETLGATTRIPGIEPYVDFVLGANLGNKQANNTGTKQQQQALRLAALDFAFVCLDTFNEDLILIANETAIPVDNAIATTDLATYVKLHPFARVMEWIYNNSVVEAIFGAIHEEPAEIGNASPDSPLILGIIRAVEIISKILDLQDTYVDLVRQVIRSQADDRRKPVSAAYSYFEEAIANHLGLMVDLGSFCGLGHPTLTLACLKLLEKISTSSKLISAWNPGPGRHAHRNKAVVALEKDGAADVIAGAFVSEMIAPLDPGLEADAPNYSIKTYILDFLYACLQASPDRPTVAHLLLGFKCNVDTLDVGPSFQDRTSLFHNLIRVLFETPFGDEALGMRRWLILLKHKTMRIFQVLWRSPLSSRIVLDDLRENNCAFHLLLREVTAQDAQPWDGLSVLSPAFPTTDASIGFVDFWALRAMTLEYVGMELCSVAQQRLPGLKRRIFDALSGTMANDSGEPMDVVTVFDLYDFLSSNSNAMQWDREPPPLKRLRDVDLRAAVDETATGDAVYDLAKVREIVLLKAAELLKEATYLGDKALEDLRDELHREEAQLLEHLVFMNRKTQLASNLQVVLQSWARLLLVMFEANEFEGAARVTFLLQALQAILPGLEAASTDNPVQAFELARLAEVLLYKLFSDPSDAGGGGSGRQMSSLVSDKLFQLFQICLYATCKWVNNPDLRTVYYNICYRYVAGLLDQAAAAAATAAAAAAAAASATTGGPGSSALVPATAASGWQKAHTAVTVCGERVLNGLCDDAYGSDSTACQTAALVLLGALVRLGAQAHDPHVVATLHRLNFIGVLVDSLRTTLQDARALLHATTINANANANATANGSTVAQRDPQQQAQDAKLALLLQLCQTRDGAAYALHANLFRAVEASGLFAADPELQVAAAAAAAVANNNYNYGNTTMAAKNSAAASLVANTAALAQHYALLVQVARVLGAAVVSRGAHTVQQGRRFLTTHRMLVVHVLKRSAGIGATGGSRALDEQVADLAEAFMVLIAATDFLEFEDETPAQPQKNPARVLFH
ncbi:nuclear pore complex subunit [Niveomyces insectorum RCEF 264]|uniref:Nuclear pore complex subunit n=1 Tax=Niveomyces insectorum RCEF 264 TaxID=1081102 RepID=A0A167UYJ8_9HYPO|nr:nuclear pore complex subunit [Niveomyces insectorum RCEF 264]